MKPVLNSLNFDKLGIIEKGTKTLTSAHAERYPQTQRFTLLALPLAACTASLADTAVTRWPAHYLGGVAPDILNPKLAAKARELGFDSFALKHSGITPTPLWAAPFA